ncbi:hypothetical protein DL98DRAFT_593951 [Cadophora sp. DSE1049]|nr:hypothetical protein DL98DRAFT_593951 [Cadophora sp. DSE1049]
MSQLKFRVTIDFRIAFKDPSTKPLTNDEYRERVIALVVEIEGKIHAMGLPASATRDEGKGDSDIASRNSVMEFYPGLLNKFEHWIVRNPPLKELFPLNCNSFYKLCLWTPWLINSAESISSLRKFFQVLENEYEVLFSLDWKSNDCVMEVRVAQDDGYFALQQVKNTMAFLWSFEKKLDGLHEAREVDDRDTQWTHRQSVRNRCALSWSHHLKPLSGEEELDKIFACTSTKEIYDLIIHPDPWGSLVYGMDNWSTDENNCLIQGFKFEQERPTLGFDRVENWLMVCFGIVNFTAKEKSTADMRRFITFRMEDETYTPFILLTDLGLQEQAEYYRTVAIDRATKGRATLDALEVEVDAALSLGDSD